jgi:hypothetical protein
MDNTGMYLNLTAMFVQSPIELISNLQEFKVSPIIKFKKRRKKKGSLSH